MPRPLARARPTRPESPCLRRAPREVPSPQLPGSRARCSRLRLLLSTLLYDLAAGLLERGMLVEPPIKRPTIDPERLGGVAHMLSLDRLDDLGVGTFGISHEKPCQLRITALHALPSSFCRASA